MEQTKENVEQIFTKYLKAHSLRQTPERLAILDKIYSLKGHFEVEQLYLSMQGSDYPVSRATLYNTIDLLVNCNLVTKHQFGKNNLSIFEKVYDKSAHHYAVCTACGKIEKFSDANIKLAMRSKKIKKFDISHYALYAYGTCEKCKKEKEPVKSKF